MPLNAFVAISTINGALKHVGVQLASLEQSCYLIETGAHPVLLSIAITTLDAHAVQAVAVAESNLDVSSTAVARHELDGMAAAQGKLKHAATATGHVKHMAVGEAEPQMATPRDDLERTVARGLEYTEAAGARGSLAHLVTP